VPSPVPRLTLGISTLLTSQTRSRRVETSKAPNPHCLFTPPMHPIPSVSARLPRTRCTRCICALCIPYRDYRPHLEIQSIHV